jgi:HEPN domain-containing protein
MLHMPSYVVCSALSVELALKCILRLSDQPTIQTHDLLLLYRKSPEHWQKRVRRRYEISLTRPDYGSALHDGSLSPYITVALRRNAQLFVQWRYVFEGNAADYQLDCAREAIHLAILDVKPEWKSERRGIALLPASPAQ